MMSDDNNIMGNYQNLKLSNAMLIGLMAGIQQVIGRGGTQAVINMAGEFVGLEMMRFARDQNIPITDIEELQ